MALEARELANRQIEAATVESGLAKEARSLSTIGGKCRVFLLGDSAKCVWWHMSLG
jgi:hypothetical protein